eukprot:3958152-Amphidinium_carterae.1
MPLSGSVPLKAFVQTWNLLMTCTSRITWSPLPRSAPSKLFMLIANSVTALDIVQMPLTGSVL